MVIRISRLSRFMLAFLIALGISFAISEPSSAQFSLPGGIGLEGTTAPPYEVTRYGNIEAVSVKSPLSDQELFTIASPTVFDRDASAIGEQVPVEHRAEAIRDNLLLLINRPMDPETLLFEVSTLNNAPIIDVRDAEFTQPLIIATVTEYDANYVGTPANELATVWRDALEDDLLDGLRNLPEGRERVRTIVSYLIVFSIVVFGFKFALSRRQKQLRHRKKAINAEAMPVADDGLQTEARPISMQRQVEQKRTNHLRKLQQVFTLDRQLSVLDFVQWMLFWLVILAWFIGEFWVYQVSPYILLNSPIGEPLDIIFHLLTIWFLTSLAVRICRRLIDHFAIEREGFNLGHLVAFGDEQRRQLRTATIAGSLKGLVTIVIVVIGLLNALQSLEISTVSLVAITSVAGLAITFGSQNLVKDLVNGFFILAEDQYAIGDVIDIGSAAGLVENLNLRVTQLRSGGGELVTIPNSSISQVKNLTRNWSRVSFNIEVAYETSPDEALAVLDEVAQTLYNDPEWHDKMLAEPKVLGIDSVSHSGMAITIMIQTKPAQQWGVGRELRLRVRRAMSENNIDIGTPRTAFVKPAVENTNGALAEQLEQPV
ncbi:transporter, MscS family [Synechococcus sp. PCC 7335]|uniref:mechanosensitive ion channel family protein n=1 Tax=Synechococcus sp. (strain ATCC 29403 / PCC 7335) TaxID=91464 RepID=UPI00017EBCD3|nr:mechanosensitive ion channel family protein [Synechococcus sp. PCC 7335]EDX83269.1 transporter, MscS family [Synechococcus sp. PCC 7335]